jgi:TATA element modulatory factor
LARSDSKSRTTNDRLQERLAKAMARSQSAARSAAESDGGSKGGSRSESPAGQKAPTHARSESRTSVDSRPPSTVGGTSAEELTRTSEDRGERKSSEIQSKLDGTTDLKEPEVVVIPATPSKEGKEFDEEEALPRFSIDSASTAPSHVSSDTPRNEIPPPANIAHAVDHKRTASQNSNASTTATRSLDEYEAENQQLRADYEVAELRRQEEIHSYTERIDALESKLQYLAREASNSAHKTAASAASGSAEKKLAEKDEQIALLMEEGQKLSKAELKYMTNIKKLRAKMAEDDKALKEAKTLQEKAEKAAQTERERAKRAAEVEKRANEKMRQLSRLEKEVDNVKAERDTSASDIAALQAQLKEANARADDAEKRVQTHALEAEKKRAADLADDLTSLKIEKEIGEEQSRTKLRELTGKMEREKERSRITELELKGELTMLESKMEVLRAQAEEVSSGATGDAQVKLLRQIETLQSQYAIASENWQGIEGTLMSRVSALEKERDELSKKESDVRRKARELVSTQELLIINLN